MIKLCNSENFSYYLYFDKFRFLFKILELNSAIVLKKEKEIT